MVKRVRVYKVAPKCWKYKHGRRKARYCVKCDYHYVELCCPICERIK